LAPSLPGFFSSVFQRTGSRFLASTYTPYK
jgi:hypothetical protein